ncbi:FmdB family zinc ribbon protein [Thermodesulfobacteriota bacterium]
MPLFDFVCLDCGEEFETLLMGSDTPVCPKCRSKNLEKKMSAFSFRSGQKGGSGSNATPSGSGSKCSGCAGGSCSTC